MKQAELLGVTLSLACVACYISLKLFQRVARNKKYSSIATKKSKRDFGTILKQEMSKYGVESDQTSISAISRLSLAELQRAIESRQFSSLQVVAAYCQAAIDSDAKYNCLSDQIFAEALLLAKECDEYYETHNTLKGPLHGIPISFKDCFDIQGLDSTLGNFSYADKPAKQDSVVVSQIKAAGGIPFVKTNLMQSVLGYESRNPLFGYVLNPRDISRTAGGSSGGEGALVSSGGSIVGFGNDIGGSVRVPALFCGISGFKPTPQRISGKGVKRWESDQLIIADAVGPLAKNVSDLIIVTKVVFSDSSDCYVPPCPWNDTVFSRQIIKFGYMVPEDKSIFYGFQRALQESVLQVKSHYTVEPFQLPSFDFVNDFLAAMSADGFDYLAEELKNDKLDGSLRSTLLLGKMPRSVRYLLGTAVGRWSRLSSLLKKTGKMSVKDLGKLKKQIQVFKEQFLQEWKRTGIDVLLCPPFDTVALKHGMERNTTPIIGKHSFLFNLLEFPAGVVTVTNVSEEDVKSTREVNDPIDHFLKKNEVGSVGLPLGVQVVALPYQDEICLKAMEVIESLSAYRNNQ